MRTPVLGRLVLICLVVFVVFAVGRSFDLSALTSAILGVGVAVLMELALSGVRRRAGAARLAADLERQKIAEEDARVAREKALARAKASGAFDRFGTSKD
ncbi:MAG: hypothetical protein AAF714_03555 [Pseudomonadota bacterium]